MVHIIIEISSRDQDSIRTVALLKKKKYREPSLFVLAVEHILPF